MNNAQLRSKPFYVKHRELAGAPVAADSADLAVLLTANPRSVADCAGYKTVRGFVKLTGGTVPTVKVQAIELVKWEGGQFFNVASVATASLADGEAFEFTVCGALLFVRLDTVANAPTGVDIYLSGAEVMPGVAGTGRG